MSTGLPASQQREDTSFEASSSPARESVQFPRLELPPVPTFRAPVTRADEIPVQRRLLDEPPSTWQSPFPEPEPTNAYSFQVVSPPPASIPSPVAPDHGFPRSAFARSTAQAMAPASAPAPPPAPRATVPAMVKTETAPAATEAGSPAGIEVSTDVSNVVLALFIVAAAMLMWASRMAFSPALLAMGALLVSEVGIALALVGPRSSKRSTSATIAAAGSLVVALLAVKGALAGFGETAFVASLFVLAAALPTLLLLGVATLVLRRRTASSLADEALRAGTGLRFGAALALLVSGYVAKDSFSAKPDALVAFVLVVLVSINAVHVLRSTGRAASAGRSRAGASHQVHEEDP